MGKVWTRKSRKSKNLRRKSPKKFLWNQKYFLGLTAFYWETRLIATIFQNPHLAGKRVQKWIYILKINWKYSQILKKIWQFPGRLIFKIRGFRNSNQKNANKPRLFFFLECWPFTDKKKKHFPGKSDFLIVLLKTARKNISRYQKYMKTCMEADFSKQSQEK